MKKSAKKTRGAAKRATKDLTPKMESSVKGGAGAGAAPTAGWDLKQNKKTG